MANSPSKPLSSKYAVAVENIKDGDAAVPLVTQVAYGKNKTVRRELLSAIAP
jgi:hypothetical protein